MTTWRQKAALLAIALAPASVLATEPADVIFTGEHIITVDSATPDADAVAIAGAHIIAVGRQEDVLKLQGSNTRMVSLGDHALLPGFIDAHGHAAAQSRILRFANIAPPPVGNVTDIASLQQALTEYIQNGNLADGQWLVGFGYDDSLLAEGRHPDREDLDAVSEEHPIFLMHASGHLGTVNSMALAKLGITADSADPPGGLIRRRPGSTEPDGVLEESASIQIYASLPQPGIEQSVEAISSAQNYYAGKGLTTIQEGGATPADIRIFRQAAAESKLWLDFVAYPYWMPDQAPMPDDEYTLEYTGRFRIGGIKLAFDGSPQGKTAFLSQPFYVPPAGQDASYRGYPSYPEETAFRAVEEVLAAGNPLLVHANGDAAEEMLIDAVAQATARHALRDTRVVMIHAQTVRDDQLDRMVTLGMIPSFFSAHTFFWGDWHRESVLGPVRADRISPARSALDRGLPFTVHNDAPITPADPITLMWSTVTRRTRSNDILGPFQRVSAMEAIRALTINGAYQYFEENSKGSITVGKLADLVVLSADPIQTEPENLRDIQVVETFSHGQSVYRNTP
jgi:predicted amidohydrolase YtcJ